ACRGRSCGHAAAERVVELAGVHELLQAGEALEARGEEVVEVEPVRRVRGEDLVDARPHRPARLEQPRLLAEVDAIGARVWPGAGGEGHAGAGGQLDHPGDV